MKLLKNTQPHYKVYDDQVIVFVPSTGQTHCLDNNISEVLNLLSNDKPSALSQLMQFFLHDCTNDEKTILNNYIQDMIDNLLKLKLIRVCS